MIIFRKLLAYWKEISIVIFSLFLNVIGILLIPRITVDIINKGVAKGDINFIIRQGGLMLLVAFLSSLFMVISVKYSTRVATSFASDLRSDLFQKVQKISIHQFEKIGAASLIVRTTDDIAQIQNVTKISLRLMLRAPLMFVGGIIMALSTNLRLSTVFLVSLPITMVGIWLFTSRMFPVSKKVRDSLDNINKTFRQRLTGIRVIRAFDKEIKEEEAFSKDNGEYTRLFKLTGDYVAIFGPSIGLIMNLTLVAILYFGSKLIIINMMQVGDLIGFIQYANNIMFSFLFISMLIAQIPRAMAAINRVVEVLNLEPEILNNGKELLGKIESLEFRNVSFSYPDSRACALKNISFKAKKGDVIGIIGSTGSGKTTLANLLVRFYEPTEGEILINNKNIKDYDIHSLREKIGYTEQKPSLIAGTISKNVKMGLDKNLDMELLDALSVAQADFVLDREEGLEAEVAQKGKNFSGGQKQRISIARAIYKKPELYLIDDSFSALDYKTERALRQELFQNTSGTIMLVITQRAAVVCQSDAIVLLDNGQMLDKGSHKELKERSLEYREILESQDFEAGEHCA